MNDYRSMQRDSPDEIVVEENFKYHVVSTFPVFDRMR